MTFHDAGFRSFGVMGIPAADSPAGSVRQLHSFTTNDDAAAIETSNYFDALLDPVRVKTGDILLASYDINGTPGFGLYQVTVSGGHVVIKAAAAAGTAVAKLTGTLTGTVDGALADVGATNGSDVSGAINTNFKEIQTTLNALIDALS